jgi:sulfur carrier protein ThiS adenylyltransferase
MMRFTEIENHLRKFRVGIAGAGGLGSNCAAALARSGVGTIVISDNDVVEKSNISRQYYFIDQVGIMKTDAIRENLLRINPDVTVITFSRKLNRVNIHKVFSGCDVVVEAFDHPEMKEMIIETLQVKMPSTPIVIGSGIAGWGNNESIRYRKIDSTLHVCGDETLEVNEDLPAMAPRIGIVASMQANVVIEILLEKIKR